MERISPHVKLRGEERDRVAARLAARYRDGRSIRDLMAETGRSYGAVYRLLGEAGVTMRPRGGDHGGGAVGVGGGGSGGRVTAPGSGSAGATGAPSRPPTQSSAGASACCQVATVWLPTDSRTAVKRPGAR
jgi:hypothetical protein